MRFSLSLDYILSKVGSEEGRDIDEYKIDWETFYKFLKEGKISFGIMKVPMLGYYFWIEIPDELIKGVKE